MSSENKVEKFQELKDKVESLKMEKVRLETQVKSIEAQLQEIIADLLSKGIKPENLKQTIADLEASTTEQVAQLEKLIKGTGEKDEVRN